MCITFFYINPRATKPYYRLVLVANRDESFDRHSTPANRWKEDASIIGGRDMESISQGTWLAASLRGKIGILLNIDRKPPNANAVSRGTLVSEFLKDDTSTSEFCKTLTNDQRSYNGFHLLLLDLSSNDTKAYVQSKLSESKISEPKELEEGYHGFSNSSTDLPYKKVTNGKRQFESIVEQYNHINQREVLIDELLKLAKSQERHYPDDILFESKRCVMNEEFIERLSSIFVSIPEKRYGTRTHTIILVTHDNQMDFNEYTMSEPVNVDNPEWIHSQFLVRLGN